MKREEFDELIGLYLSKEVSIEDKKKIREDLLTEGFTADELDELLKMDEKLTGLPIGSTSPEMNSTFYNWLEKEKRIQNGDSGFKYVLKYIQGPAGRIAAGIALFIVGWLGNNLFNQRAGEVGMLNAELTDIKQSLVLTKMQQESSIDRIQAVNMVNELSEVDDAVIESLLTVLTSDRNDNVRLAALESILPYADSPIVREGLIRSISKQSSPLVQLRLAEIMRAIQDPDAIPEIRKILESKNLNYNVKTKYTEALNLLI